MDRWEYCEVDFDGKVARSWFYDEAGVYINRPTTHARLGILMAQLGHDGWELVSTFWRSRSEVTYMLKRRYQDNWTDTDRQAALEHYRQLHPRDRQY